jgi:hypothetical protein
MFQIPTTRHGRFDHPERIFDQNFYIAYFPPRDHIINQPAAMPSITGEHKPTIFAHLPSVGQAFG